LKAVLPATNKLPTGTPGLLSVEFTRPYFYNGGQATLEQVVGFYWRGSDFPAVSI
jgi:cytochrome c peroxidase